MEPDPSDKYRIKEVLGKVLIWFLKIPNQKEYGGQKRLGLLQLLRNMVATWKTFWLRQN